MVQYTKEQTETARRTYSVIAAIPADKRILAAALAEAFMNGMIAQEQLYANVQPSAAPLQMVCPGP